MRHWSLAVGRHAISCRLFWDLLRTPAATVSLDRIVGAPALVSAIFGVGAMPGFMARRRPQWGRLACAPFVSQTKLHMLSALALATPVGHDASNGRFSLLRIALLDFSTKLRIHGLRTRRLSVATSGARVLFSLLVVMSVVRPIVAPPSTRFRSRAWSMASESNASCVGRRIEVLATISPTMQGGPLTSASQGDNYVVWSCRSGSGNIRSQRACTLILYPQSPASCRPRPRCPNTSPQTPSPTPTPPISHP